MTFDEMLAELNRVLPSDHPVHAVPSFDGVDQFAAVYSGDVWLGNLMPTADGVSARVAYSPFGENVQYVSEGMLILLGESL